MKHVLQVMSYNVRYDEPTDRQRWAERKAAIQQIIQQEDPDLLGLQECLYHQINDLVELLPEYNWIGQGREGGSHGEYTPIFYKKSRFELMAYNYFWLSDFPDQVGSATWGNELTRMAVWALFKDRQTGQIFYHLNTHFDHETEFARQKSAELIAGEVAGMKSDIPIIVTADFNTGYQSETHVYLTEKAGYMDSWDIAEAKENTEYGSFNNFQDSTGGPERIDWILLKGSSFRVLKTKLVIDQINYTFPSDHFPIVAQVII